MTHLGIDIFSQAGRIAPNMFATKSFPRIRRPYPLLQEKAGIFSFRMTQ